MHVVNTQEEATIISLVIAGYNGVIMSKNFWKSHGVGRRLFLGRQNL